MVSELVARREYRAVMRDRTRCSLAMTEMDCWVFGTCKLWKFVR